MDGGPHPRKNPPVGAGLFRYPSGSAATFFEQAAIDGDSQLVQ